MTVLAAILLLSSSVSATSLPDEVVAYIRGRELCEHLRREPFEGQTPERIERREFLRQSVEIHCSGTDRRLAALKLRYKENAAALLLPGKYEPLSEAPCSGA